MPWLNWALADMTWLPNICFSCGSLGLCIALHCKTSPEADKLWRGLAQGVFAVYRVDLKNGLMHDRHMSKIVSTILYLLLAAPCGFAQGLAGSDMPKQIFGRTDRSDTQIAALNAELDQRRLILGGLALLVSANLIAYKLRKKKKPSA